MKILSITAQKPHSTGSGTYLTELVKAWDRKGHTQAVVAGVYKEDTVCFPAGVDFHPVYFDTPELPFHIVGMSDIMPYNSTRYRDMDKTMLEAFETAFVRAISEAIDTLNPDIIFCHHLFLLTALVNKHFGSYTIYGVSHGTDLRQIINCPELAEAICPEIAGLDRIYALHKTQAETITDLLGDVSGRLSVIGSGYNQEVFNCEGRADCHIGNNGNSVISANSRSNSQPPRIIYAGKLSKPKGVAELLTAVKNLNVNPVACDTSNPSTSDFELVLAGGCQDKNIQAELNSLPSNVSYAGMLPQNELAELFKAGDIFILPSYFEGLPLVLIEAMASGLVPICTDLPGIREWIDANVPDNNIIWIPMPHMATVDTPIIEDVPNFVQNIESSIKSALAVIARDREVPDTSSITWDSVAAKILT